MGNVTISTESWRKLEKIAHSMKGLRNLQRLSEDEAKRVAGHMSHHADELRKWIRKEKAAQLEEARSGT